MICVYVIHINIKDMYTVYSFDPNLQFSSYFYIGTSEYCLFSLRPEYWWQSAGSRSPIARWCALLVCDTEHVKFFILSEDAWTDWNVNVCINVLFY